MPLIEVQLSTRLPAEAQGALMKSLSQTVARGLGKPEAYMMVVLRSEVPLLMGGRSEPAALVEIRSVGTISPGQAGELANAVTESLAEAAGLEEDRVYCILQGVPGALWAQAGQTFG